ASHVFPAYAPSPARHRPDKPSGGPPPRTGATPRELGSRTGDPAPERGRPAGAGPARAQGGWVVGLRELRWVREGSVSRQLKACGGGLGSGGRGGCWWCSVLVRPGRQARLGRGP
ncbi:hypothetical protein ACFXN1_38090, partial [Nocardia sp. NPDC059154]